MAAHDHVEDEKENERVLDAPAHVDHKDQGQEVETDLQVGFDPQG